MKRKTHYRVGLLSTFLLFSFCLQGQVLTNESKVDYLKRIGSAKDQIALGRSLAAPLNATPYCMPVLNCTDRDDIQKVQFETLSNTSGCGTNGYSDYTALQAPDLTSGQSYPIAVTVGNGWSNESVSVWIDYNDNGLFEASEFRYIGTGSGSVVNGTITIPSNATQGLKRMRVRVAAVGNAAATADKACDQGDEFGETEDYTVNIIVGNTGPTVNNLIGDAVAWPGVGNTVRLDVAEDATVTDADFEALNGGNGDWAGATINVQRNVTAASSDVFGFNTSGTPFTVSGSNLQSGGLTFATFSTTGGALNIVFTSSGTTATTALVNSVIKNITYRNDTPAGDAVVRFTISDGSLVATADVTVNSDFIYVTNSNDTPVIDPSNGVSFSEAVAIAAADATGMQTLVFASNLAGINMPLAGNLSINESLTIDASAANGLNISGSTITLGGGTTWDVANSSGTLTMSSNLAGSGSLTKSGAGTLRLAGVYNKANMSGGMAVTGGILQVDNDNNLSSGALNLNGGTLNVTTNGTTIFNNIVMGNNGGTLHAATQWTAAGVIAGGASTELRKTGTGTLKLTNQTNSATSWSFGQMEGTTVVTTGKQLGTGKLKLSGGTLAVNATSPLTLNQPIEVINAAAIDAYGSNTGVILELNGQMNGSGALILDAGDSQIYVSNANTTTGTLTFKSTGSGIVAAVGTGTFGTSQINLDAGTTLGIAGDNRTLPNNIVLLGDATIRTGIATVEPGAITLSGVISETGGGHNLKILAYMSSIKFTDVVLSGLNTYSGTTTVETGRLLVNGKVASATTAMSGTTLGGTGTIEGNVVIESGATLSPGMGNINNGVGLLTVQGNLAINAGGTLKVQVEGTTAGTQYDCINLNGTISVANATIAVNHTYTAAHRDTYTIINNDGLGAITGMFSGLTEGGTLTAGGNGTVLTASYIGGTGNDFTLTAPINTAPTNITLSNSIINENVAPNTIIGTLSTTDADLGDTFTYSLVAGAGSTDNAAFNISGNSLRINASPDYETKSSYSIRIRSTDSYWSTFEKSFVISIADVNAPPVLAAIGNKTVNEGTLLTFTASATDDGEPNGTLMYSLVGAEIPHGAAINEGTGVFNWTPTEAQGPGSYTFTIVVSDGVLTDEEQITITVDEVNVAPVATNDSYFTDEDTPLIIAAPGLLANDTDSDFPTQTLTAETVLPPAKGTLTFNANGSFTYTPNANFYGADNFRYWVSDGSLFSNIATVTITVNPVNDAPAISGTPATTVDQGAAYSFVPTASDIEDDVLTFSINNKPAWATFNTATGELAGTPSNADVGTTMGIVIFVSDGSRSTSLPPFTITIVNVNDAPTISMAAAPTSVLQGQLYDFTPVSADIDGDVLIYDAVNLPGWLSVDPNTGRIWGTPTNEDVGTHPFETYVRVSDDNGVNWIWSESDFFITVVNVNDAPIISGTPATLVNQDIAYSFIPTATDIDASDVLTFSITNKPAWATFNTATGALSGTPRNADLGTTTGIVITVSDGTLSASLPAFDLTVANVNDAPVISGTPATSVNQDAVYSFIPTATDIDAGDVLTFSITNKPTWASFNTMTGALTGTPGNADVGTTVGIVITVSDGTLSVSLPAFDLKVVNVNDAPAISGTPATSVNQDVAYSFIPAATDIDAGDVLTFSITNKPAWATFNTTTGALTGTPGNADVGTTTGIVITVSDGTLSASLPAFDLKVVNVNDAPAISGTPATSVNQDVAYSFIPTATDIDAGDVLSFSIINKPTWASFNTTTGALTGTPHNADVGTTVGIVITVSDGTLSASLPAFDLTVVNVNDAPAISGTPATSVNQDEVYTFIPTATDMDAGDVLTFSITNKPTWATFNTTTGALTGTPGNADVGTTTGIVITVSDGTLSASLPAFSLEVKTVLITGISLETGSFTYDGTAKSLAIKGKLPQGTTVSYTGNEQINAGLYTVTAVVSGGNYKPLTLTAEMTINKAKQTINFNAPGDLSREAGTVALDVKSTSGLPVSLTSDDVMIATVSGTDLNVLRLGTVRITASQVGNENYDAASPVTVSVRVANDASAKLPIRVHQALSPNGDGVNEFLMIEGIRDYPDNKVTIFDKNGVVLAEIDGYDNRDRVFFGNDHRDGTYFYYIDVKDNGVWKREKGYFVIRR